MSIEHIIPESLGNTEHFLPAGIVCDNCNNYIAREIEKPFLDSIYIKEKRFFMEIKSKKQRFPLIDGIHLESGIKVQLDKNIDGISVGVSNEKDEQTWITEIMNSKSGSIIIPTNVLPDDYIISRFVAKIGIETLALRLLNVPGGIEEIIEKKELDELRDYIRKGSPNNRWPFYKRNIYSPEHKFQKDYLSYEVLHEWDILGLDNKEYYIVVIIFGDEYVLNLGGRELDGYKKWLIKNNNKCFLYTNKNA